MTDAIARFLRSVAGDFYANYTTKLPGQVTIHDRAGIWIGTLDSDLRPIEDRKKSAFKTLAEAGEWYLSRIRK